MEAIDAQGDGEELSVDGYAVDIDAAGEGWVRVTRWGAFKQIRVSYEAGLAAEAEALPEALRHGIVRLAAHLYTHRDRENGAGSAGGGDGALAAVAAAEAPLMFEGLEKRVEAGR